MPEAIKKKFFASRLYFFSIFDLDFRDASPGFREMLCESETGMELILANPAIDKTESERAVGFKNNRGDGHD